MPRRRSRREFVNAAVAGLGGVLAASRRGDILAGEAPPQRPNILWLSCEDINPHLGCYGDAYARTPHLDAFAARGIRYTNAFGVTGVCAPNRSCLITGVFPSALGSHHMRCTTRLPEAVKCFPEYLRAAGYYCTNNAKTDYNFAVPRTAWDECSRQGHWRNRKPGQPFFAVFNCELSHESQIRQPEASFAKNTASLTPGQRHDPAKAPIPPYHPDTPEARRDWARYHDLITATDYWFADKLKELGDAGLADDTIVFFFGDNGAGMPGCKKWVWDSGLRVPLIVHFPAKFAALAPGEPGSAADRLVSFVDFAPTVLSLAGVKVPAHMQGSAFLGAQAGEPRQFIHAIRDRMAERYDIVRVVRDHRYQYHRNFHPHLSWSQFTSYTEEMPTMRAWRRLAEEGKLSGTPARYFSPAKPIEELYDNESDPHQITNLAADPQQRATLERLREECVAWMKRTGDLGLLPEFEMERRSRGSTPWDIRLDPAKNPLDRLLAATEVANAMDAANVPRLIELLGDGDAAVRWWGALGLVALGDKAAPAADALGKALGDAAPNVRIAAADALGNLGRHEQALPVLIEGLRHESAFIRLRALNALERLGDEARPALPDIAKAALSEKSHVGDYVGRMVQYLPQKLKP